MVRRLELFCMRLAVAIIIGLGSGLEVSAQRYFILNNPSSGAGVAYDLAKSDGSLTVVGAADFTQALQAFRWTLHSGLQNIDTLGSFRSWAYGVSATGTTVVGVATFLNPTRWRGFRWVQGVGMQLLTIPSGYSHSWAYDVSADGRTIVGRCFSTTEGYRAVLWRDGTPRVLQTLGGRNDEARSVTPSGFLAVGTSANSSGQIRAVRWTHTGSILELGTLGGSSSWAMAISADHQTIVGFSADANNARRAFRWTEQTGMQDLGTLPGYNFYEAHAVSADGRVIVGVMRDSNFSYRAFRWTPRTGMQDLTNAYGHITGSVLEWALAVSHDGRYIAGQGWNQVNGWHAFLLDTWRTGDTNGDDCVDDSDLLAVLFDFGQTGYRPTDLNGDGIVDDADLLLVLFNFGQGC